MPGHGPPSIKRDFQTLKRLAKRAAVLGAILAGLCHFLPPHWRPICDALASVCTGGK